VYKNRRKLLFSLHLFGARVPVLVFVVHPPGANFGKFGVFFYFNPPPLIIDQMQMQGVDFMDREIIDHSHYFFFGEEMARHIEHKSAPSECRTIRNADNRNQPFHVFCVWGTFNFGRK